MKRLLFLFAAIGMTALTSCEGDQGPQGPPGASTEASVFELNSVDFNFNSGYFISGSYPSNLQVLDSDVVLMYRLSDLIDSSTPIWQQIPRTLFSEAGEVDYDFDFSAIDFQIYVGGTFELTPEYTGNQTFRIVVIPGQFVDRSAAPKVDLSDYNAVIKAYNIDDSNIQIIK
ncbi:MAG: hypothetical protein EOP06_17930 [Proteobacteria bacterium]|nr:MAG: hypothetical protein EOP06_17930 [Pseudomonadota bacterium]